MIITVDLLRGAIPSVSLERAKLWVPHFQALSDWCISDTPETLAAYLAVTSHETGDYMQLEENLNYSAEGHLKTWPEHFTSETARDYAHTPDAIANRVYANRMGNGPESSGDGYLYRGRGLFQITGKANYLKCGYQMELELFRNPDLLTMPPLAVESSAIFWSNHSLNDLAEAGKFQELRRVVNGGDIGMSDYLKRLNYAWTYLSKEYRYGRP